MLRKIQDGVHWLEFELLADFPRLKHGVFLRHGGSSMGTFASFNLSHNLGDRVEHVEANLKKAAQIMGVTEWLWGQQVHSNQIELVTTSPWNYALPCDALATSLPNKGLMIHHADCQAAILYDPIQHSLCTVHCGWRGSVLNIYASAIALMKKTFHSSPQDILVCISPSLGPESAEFIHYRQELPETFWEYQIKPHYFDFWAISEMQLLKEGILREHIQIAGYDTKARPEDYFSYRYNKIRGGHGTVAILN